MRMNCTFLFANLSFKLNEKICSKNLTLWYMITMKRSEIVSWRILYDEIKRIVSVIYLSGYAVWLTFLWRKYEVVKKWIFSWILSTYKLYIVCWLCVNVVLNILTVISRILILAQVMLSSCILLFIINWACFNLSIELALPSL